MMKIYVWTIENYDDGIWNFVRSEVRYKRPRRYMCSWSFDMLLKYVKNELEWMDINPKEITSFEIINDKEGWCESINNPKFYYDYKTDTYSFEEVDR